MSGAMGDSIWRAHAESLRKFREKRLKIPLGICFIFNCDEDATHYGKTFGHGFCDTHRGDS